MQIASNNLANYEAFKQTPVNPDVEKQPVKNSANKDEIFDFIDKKIIPITSFGSAAINLISAPTRLYDDDNPLKKIINKISMIATKAHLALYGAIGMWTANNNKNPFLLFSFATECLSSLLNLRKIYLFRGIATGVDGAVSAFKDRFEKQNPGKTFKHDNYKEGFETNVKHFKEILNEIKERPKVLTELQGEHTLVSSSIMMVLGSIIGLTVNDKLGATMRDFFGGLNDFGLTQIDNKTAKKSGFLYLLGTVKDIMARAFTENTAKLFGVTEIEKFKRGRDVLHELALAFDRMGQFFFLRFNQESNDQEKVETVKKAKDTTELDLHKAQEINTQLAA